jgi:hypothetical protein
MCKASSLQKLTETWQQFVTNLENFFELANLENYIYVKADLIVIASYMYTARTSAVLPELHIYIYVKADLIVIASYIYTARASAVLPHVLNFLPF